MVKLLRDDNVSISPDTKKVKIYVGNEQDHILVNGAGAMEFHQVTKDKGRKPGVYLLSHKPIVSGI